MKKILALIALLSSSAYAAPLSAGYSHVVLSTGTTIGTSVYVPLITNTVKAIKGISIYNTSSSSLLLGIAPISSSSNTETAQIVVPASMTAGSAIYLPLVLSQSYRISALAITTSVFSGVVDVNVFYN